MDQEQEGRLKDVLEQAASQVLSEKLGLELDETGRVNPDEIDEELLQENAKEVILGMLGAFVGEMSNGALWDTMTQSAPAPSTEDKSKSTEEEIAPILSFFEMWQKQSEQDVASKLKESLGVPLDENGAIDLMALETKETHLEIAKHLSDIVENIGQSANALREKITELQPLLDSKAASAPEEEQNEEAETVTPDPPQKDNVLDFDSWRDRISDKKGDPGIIGKNIQDTIGRFFEEQMENSPDGAIRLDLDDEFFKNNAPVLFSEVMKTLSDSLVPPKIDITLPMAPEEEGATETNEEKPDSAEPEQTGDEPGSSELKLSVNLDLGNILRSFFQPQDNTIAFSGTDTDASEDKKE